ncbi:MAG: hypothetical protein HOP17_07490 [Acidobacteria bacterium]|nr:hypothetical protein [Acidobacteriota bacterium]
MAKKKESITTQNGNGLRDYSHLPRLKDLPKPKKLTPLQKELKKATHEALQALEEEEKKYGVSLA